MKNMVQFLGIKWQNGVPKFMLCDDNDLCFFDIPEKLNIYKTNIKKCHGYYDLEKRIYVPCKNRTNLTDSKFSQCKQCQDANGFGLCLGCNGSVCRADNPHGLSFCNQSHLVYLVLFPGDKFKVGTAAEYRGIERMYEQGAICSVFFARTPNGKIARQLEQAASEVGLVKNVNSSYKMNNMIFDSDLEIIKQKLAKKLNEIRPQISGFAQYFIEPEFNIFADIYNNLYKTLTETQITDLFGEPKTIIKDYEKLSDSTEITGILKSVVGELLVIEYSGKLRVISTKPMIGFDIEQM